jgi:2-iminobutanoate/2-iminopropanoate deaminase
MTPDAPLPMGPYCQAVKAGNFLFISGQLAIDPAEGRIVSANVRDQTRRVLENIEAILVAAGFSFGDVVQMNVCLSSMDSFKEFNVEYAKYFGKVFPARVTVGTELVQGALVEISAIAYTE